MYIESIYGKIRKALLPYKRITYRLERLFLSAVLESSAKSAERLVGKIIAENGGGLYFPLVLENAELVFDSGKHKDFIIPTSKNFDRAQLRFDFSTNVQFPF